MTTASACNISLCNEGTTGLFKLTVDDDGDMHVRTLNILIRVTDLSQTGNVNIAEVADFNNEEDPLTIMVYRLIKTFQRFTDTWLCLIIAHP